MNKNNTLGRKIRKNKISANHQKWEKEIQTEKQEMEKL